MIELNYTRALSAFWGFSRDENALNARFCDKLGYQTVIVGW